MREVVAGRLNLELAAVDEIVGLACELKPDEATLVPERRQELTTEGGLDVIANKDTVARAVDRLAQVGIHVSLFVDPDPIQIETAKLIGAKAVEIQTARYSEARGRHKAEAELAALTHAAAFSRSHGLHVHMGHGLNYTNVQAITRIEGVEELNIGHSIISRAVLVGMERAVREMKKAMRQS
jgi:pyridoxine 5-phosphate synthase